MKNLYLIRHGQSVANVDPSHYYTQHDHLIGLTDLGREQAKAAGERVSYLVQNRPFAIIHSPFVRASETASIIDSQCILAGKYATVHESPLLYERSWGNLRDIVDSPELDASMHFNFFYRPVSGESFADTYVRVVLFMQELRAGRYDHDDIVIVAHGEWIRLALMYLRGQSVDFFNRYHTNPENCKVILEQL
jgi:broad specificity phosphatase PhoE